MEIIGNLIENCICLLIAVFKTYTEYILINFECNFSAYNVVIFSLSNGICIQCIVAAFFFCSYHPHVQLLYGLFLADRGTNPLKRRLTRGTSTVPIEIINALPTALASRRKWKREKEPRRVVFFGDASFQYRASKMCPCGQDQSWKVNTLKWSVSDNSDAMEEGQPARAQPSPAQPSQGQGQGQGQAQSRTLGV
jgi:hypothetical protein